MYSSLKIWQPNNTNINNSNKKNKHNFTVSAGDPAPAATGAEPDEPEGLAELNEGHGPGVTTGCTEETERLDAQKRLNAASNYW